jgi:hypothetical protein
MLKEDLLTTGWNIIDAKEWPEKLISENYSRVWADCDTEELKLKLPDNLKSVAEYFEKLLIENLPEEKFFLGSVEVRNNGYFKWHIDGGYLRVIIVYEGDGPIVAKSYENNIPTFSGQAVILTGNQREKIMGIPATWHTSPENWKNRKLLILTFRNGWLDQ